MWIKSTTTDFVVMDLFLRCTNQWYIFLDMWIERNIRIHLKPPVSLSLSLCLFAVSLSSCVVTLPSASCTEHCLSGHAWLCICVCARQHCRPTGTKQGADGEETGSMEEDAHALLSERERKRRKRGRRREKHKNIETRRREVLPISPWSAAKCTDPSEGSTQSVHLFKPAGHHYLSVQQRHPQTLPHARRALQQTTSAVRQVHARIWKCVGG